MSDAITTPPTFDEMVALIEQNFKCYVQSTKAFTEAEIEEGWQRYKRLNHLYRDELPHIHKDTVEENWESFWKPIVTNEDGTINIEQIKKELHDFSFIMEQVPKVYCHITGNRMSKVMYHADTVISVADDFFQQQLDEAVKDEKGEQPGAVWVRGDYDRLYDQVKSGKRTACYVDYAARGVDRVYRDICSIHPDGMEFVARGIGYGSVKYLEGDEKANFIGLCKIKNVEWLDESGPAAIEWDSVRLIGRVKERFKELEEKQHDWRSFYIGWLEGRVDMLQQIKGYGRLSQEQADFIREANNRDLAGTAAGREEDACDFAEWMRLNCKSSQSGWVDALGKWDTTKGWYELFKQQKEK